MSKFDSFYKKYTEKQIPTQQLDLYKPNIRTYIIRKDIKISSSTNSYTFEFQTPFNNVKNIRLTSFRFSPSTHIDDDNNIITIGNETLGDTNIKIPNGDYESSQDLLEAINNAMKHTSFKFTSNGVFTSLEAQQRYDDVNVLSYGGGGKLYLDRYLDTDVADIEVFLKGQWIKSHWVAPQEVIMDQTLSAITWTREYIETGGISIADSHSLGSTTIYSTKLHHVGNNDFIQQFSNANQYYRYTGGAWEMVYGTTEATAIGDSDYEGVSGLKLYGHGNSNERLIGTTLSPISEYSSDVPSPSIQTYVLDSGDLLLGGTTSILFASGGMVSTDTGIEYDSFNVQFVSGVSEVSVVNGSRVDIYTGSLNVAAVTQLYDVGQDVQFYTHVKNGTDFHNINAIGTTQTTISVYIDQTNAIHGNDDMGVVYQHIVQHNEIGTFNPGVCESRWGTTSLQVKINNQLFYIWDGQLFDFGITNNYSLGFEFGGTMDGPKAISPLIVYEYPEKVIKLTPNPHKYFTSIRYPIADVGVSMSSDVAGYLNWGTTYVNPQISPNPLFFKYEDGNEFINLYFRDSVGFTGNVVLGVSSNNSNWELFDDVYQFEESYGVVTAIGQNIDILAPFSANGGATMTVYFPNHGATIADSLNINVSYNGTTTSIAAIDTHFLDSNIHPIVGVIDSNTLSIGVTASTNVLEFLANTNFGGVTDVSDHPRAQLNIQYDDLIVGKIAGRHSLGMQNVNILDGTGSFTHLRWQYLLNGGLINEATFYDLGITTPHMDVVNADTEFFVKVCDMDIDSIRIENSNSTGFIAQINGDGLIIAPPISFDIHQNHLTNMKIRIVNEDETLYPIGAHEFTLQVDEFATTPLDSLLSSKINFTDKRGYSFYS